MPERDKDLFRDFVDHRRQGGIKGKRFRTLGKPKINSKGQITLRFRLKVGTYRMRYSFKGNSVMARGTIYDVVRIKRVLG